MDILIIRYLCNRITSHIWYNTILSYQKVICIISKNIKSLAVKCASQVSQNVPQSWLKYKIDGIDSLQNILKRPGNITECTCDFSPASVNQFQLIYRKRFLFLIIMVSPDKIWNIDENGCPTATAKRICGCKWGQISWFDSISRSRSISDCYTDSDFKNTIPPLFFFPRGHCREHHVRQQLSLMWHSFQAGRQ